MLIFYRDLDVKKRSAECADRAAAAMEHYRDNVKTEGFVENLLVDLMHMAYAEGVDVRELLWEAEMEFEDDLNGKRPERVTYVPYQGDC